MYEAESSLSDPENEVSDNVEQNDEEKRIHSAKCGDREMKDDPTKNVPKVSVISCTESNFQEKLNKGDDENCNLQSSKDDQSQQENLKLKELSVIGQNSGLSNKPESLLFPENESHVGKLERTYNEYIIPSEHHQHTFCITLYMYVMPFKVCIHLILITQTSFTQLQFSRKLHVLRQNMLSALYLCFLFHRQLQNNDKTKSYNCMGEPKDFSLENCLSLACSSTLVIAHLPSFQE